MDTDEQELTQIGHKSGTQLHDAKCHELAEHFVENVSTLKDEDGKHANALADVIQYHIDSYLTYHEQRQREERGEAFEMLEAIDAAGGS